MKATLIAVIVCSALTIGKATGQSADTASQSNNNTMKQFSLLIRVPDTYTTEQAKSVSPKWDRLLEQWKAEGVYVISFAFPGISYTVSGKEKVIKKESVLSGNLRVVSNIVLQAETMEEALKLAGQCPVLAYGGSVEVREIPKQLVISK